VSPKRADGDVRSNVWLRMLQAQGRRVSWQPSRTFAIEVEEQLSGDIVRALVDGVTDLGAPADNIPAHGLIITLFQNDELVLLCAGTRPLAHHRRMEEGPERAAFALWQLYFETGHRHGDSRFDRTTGSGRDCQFAAGPGS